MAEPKKYEFSAWDNFKYPAMVFGLLLAALVSAGLLFFGLADVLAKLFS